VTSVASSKTGSQLELEENDPERLAEVAVVAMVNVPLTDALVPDAVSVKLKDAVPDPPEISSSSASVSSITSSMILSLILWTTSGMKEHFHAA
jgi:hypothetical protein